VKRTFSRLAELYLGLLKGVVRKFLLPAEPSYRDDVEGPVMEVEGPMMEVDLVLNMARRLAEERNLEALRFLLRMAALPLQAEALLGWAGREIPKGLEDALPHEVVPRPSSPSNLSTEKQEVCWRPVCLREATAVVSFPWSADRMEKALRGIAPRKWVYDPDNHKCVYYRPLGMVFFQNGFHSGTMGVLKGEGVVMAWEKDLRVYFHMGVQVEVREEAKEKKLWAVNEWMGTAAPFPHQAYGLLWGLAYVLYKNTVEV